jgi:hypothetical protein
MMSNNKLLNYLFIIFYLVELISSSMMLTLTAAGLRADSASVAATDCTAEAVGDCWDCCFSAEACYYFSDRDCNGGDLLTAAYVAAAAERAHRLQWYSYTHPYWSTPRLLLRLQLLRAATAESCCCDC